MAFFPRVQNYKTSVSFLVNNGLVGQQAVIEACYPPQDSLRDSEPLRSFYDSKDVDFDPIQIDFEKAIDKALNPQSEPSKTV